MTQIVEGDEFVDKVDLVEGDETLENHAYRLWHKAIKFGTWDPSAIDFSQDREQVAQLDPARRAYLERFCAAFHNAEENVARLFCPWIMAHPNLWVQAFLSTQLVEEYKHTEVFERYFEEVLGHRNFQLALRNAVHDSLASRGRTLLAALDAPEPERELRFVEAVTHYQGIIEGVQANTGYQIFVNVFARKGLLPGLSEAFRNIQQDEGRHVGFGLGVLRRFAAKDERYASAIRRMYEEYLPLIRSRYGQSLTVDGAEYPPPPEEQGVERLMKLYERRLQDIFGEAPPSGRSERPA
jgi:ribonucleoside-diphosphate reductase beta chain